MLVKFVSFAVLLSLNLVVLHDCRRPSKFSELNNYLASTVKTQKFSESFEALKMVNSLALESNGKSSFSDKKIHEIAKQVTKLSPEAIEFAGLISSLSSIDNEDSCGRQNLANLRKIVDEFHSYDKKVWNIFPPIYRLKHLLKRYTSAVADKCLESLKEILDMPLEDKYDRELVHLDRIYRVNATSEIYKFCDLIRAEKLPRMLGGVESLRLDKKIRQFYYAMDAFTDGNHANEEELYWKEYLIEPCESFLADELARDTLERVANLGIAAWRIHVHQDPRGHGRLIKWASRLLACKWADRERARAKSVAMHDKQYF